MLFAKVSARQQCVYEGPQRRNRRQINAKNIMLKSTFTGLQCCRRQHGYIFIYLAVVASQICEIPRNSPKIRTYSSSRSSKPPRSSILAPIESAYPTFFQSNNFERIFYSLTPPSGGTPCDINVIYKSLESKFTGLVVDNVGLSSFIQLLLSFGFQIYKISQNSKTI